MPDIVTLPCGIQYKVIKAAKADAESPKLGTECECHYRGTLLNGFEFDSSKKKGKPAQFAPKNVIRGWCPDRLSNANPLVPSFLAPLLTS